PGAGEFVRGVDDAVAALAEGLVVHDRVALGGEATDDDEVPGGRRHRVAGELALTEADRRDDRLAGGEGLADLAPGPEARQLGIQPEFAGAGDGTAPVAIDVVLLVEDPLGVL